MLSLYDMMMQAQNGKAVDLMARQFGLAQEQAVKAVAALMPAFSEGFKRNAANPYDLAAFMKALTTGEHAKYFEDMSKAFTPQGLAEGNGILGHLLGSKDASRAAANAASEQTGLPAQMMKQMLPVVATMVMGALSKQQASAQQEGGLMGTLTSLLDSNRDGNVADDVLGLAARFFQK